MIDQKQLENVEYFSYLGSMITNSARCTGPLAIAKAAINKKAVFTSKLDLHLRKKPVKCYIWSIALYGADTWTLRKVDQKHVEQFEMWCWRMMGKISWTDRVRNEMLHRVKEERNVVHTVERRKADWIGHNWRRDCLLKHVIGGKTGGGIEVPGRRGRRCRGDGKTRKKT